MTTARMTDPPTIWMYDGWGVNEGSRPPYLDACFRSVLRNSECLVTVVTEDTIMDYLPHAHPAFEMLHAPHKADVLRLNILYERGGMYIDFDTVVMRSLRPLFDALDSCELMGADWRPSRLSRESWQPLGISVMGPCRARLDFMKRCRDAQNTVLDTKVEALRAGGDYPILWEELLADIVTPSFYAVPPNARIKDGANSWFALVGNDDWWGGELGHPFRELDEIHDLPDSELFTFANSMFSEEQKKMTLTEILEGDTILAHLLRRALAT